MAKKETIESPHSKFKEELLSKLQKLGFIKSYKVIEDGNKANMTIELIYKEGVPALTDIKVSSRPGRRWYVSTKDMKPVMSGLGHAVVTTPKGIMTAVEAKKAQVGGELLFEIW